MTRRLSFHSLLFLLALILPRTDAPCAAPAAPAGGQTTTATLLARAMRLTAARDLAGAGAAYRELAALSPADGLPALARFLARTGHTAEAARLPDDPAAAALAPVDRARVASAAGLTTRTLAILREPAPDGQRFRQCVMLVEQLRAAGLEDEAADALAAAVLAPDLRPPERLDLTRMFLRAAPPAALRNSVHALVRQIVTSSTLGFEETRLIANEGLVALGRNPGYAEFHRSMETAAGGDATAAWLAAISCVRKGDGTRARALLDAATSRPLTAREQIMLVEERILSIPGDPAARLDLYARIIPLAPDPDRLRVAAAQAAFKLRDYARVLDLLRDVRPPALDEPRRRLCANLRLGALGAIRPGPEVVRTFEEESARLPWDALRELGEAPFVAQPETAAHRQVADALRARLAETTAPARLNVLLMSALHQLRDEDGVLDALRVLTVAEPNNAPALDELAAALALRATRLATIARETTAARADAASGSSQAARALWQAIRARPYLPENYQALMALYRAAGHDDLARRVPQRLAAPTTATAEEVQMAAFLLATAGYPEDAIPLYERALLLAPATVRYRMNYAAALRRVGRYPEAQAIYRQLLTRGAFGRQYHAHQVVEDAYLAARDAQTLNEYRAFLASLVDATTVPQHDALLLEAAEALLRQKEAGEAIRFLNAAQSRYPSRRRDAERLLQQAYIQTGRIADLEKLVAVRRAEDEKQAAAGGTPADTLTRRIEARLDDAWLLHARGSTAQAVAAWTTLAAEYPSHPQAARALLAAAQTCAQQNRNSEATTFARQFLATTPDSPDDEEAARTLLRNLEAKK